MRPIRHFIHAGLFAAGALFAGLLPAGFAAETPGIAWQPWSDAVFKQAARQHKLVLMDLEAVWCHWCHVMDGVTYADPQVIALIRDHYIPVRVDQDSRPDLANRYEDYGWPATVVFKWDGSELAKRRGYIPPVSMAAMLKAFADDPTPGPSVTEEIPPAPAAESALSQAQLHAMRASFQAAYDHQLGGWGRAQKFLEWNNLEYCLAEGAGGDAAMEQMARQTLAAGLKLIDPVWGGVDQYSVNGDWDHPHYEKIMPYQAETMRIFAMAASVWDEPRWLDSARRIHGYLAAFLTSPEGAFYTSQDADATPGQPAESYFALDDAARRKQGLPRVDRHIYSRENGLAIRGLAALYAAGGDASALSEARRAAEWILANRALPPGGFRHDAVDLGGPYLADTLEMGRAFLALYAVTGQRVWIERAKAAAEFIEAHFRVPPGYATAAPAAGALLPSEPEADENVSLARFTNLLAYYSGQKSCRDMAGHAMRYLASAQLIARQGYGVAGILLANREFALVIPTHITVTGPKKNTAAQALFACALRGAPPYSRIEWYDRAEGPLPNSDVEYPELSQPAAYVCSGSACSAPAVTPQALSQKLRRLAAQGK